MVRATVAAILTGATSLAALEPTLDLRGIEQAMAIGQTHLDRERVAFHQPYRLRVDRPPIDYIDIVSPFRRLVLASEQRARLGERSFSQRQAIELLAATPGLLEVRAELTFHPMHALARVPDYAIRLVADRRVVEPRSLERVPRFGPRVDGQPVPLPSAAGALPLPGTQPMLGGTVIAAFDGLRLDVNGAYDVLVLEAGKELARARLVLKNLR